MGLRFHRSVRIARGLRLNLSKTGLSLSIGEPGATLNLRPGRAAQVTVGLPSTGLSYRQRVGGGMASTVTARGLAWFAVLIVACYWWLS